jgi:putative FmdB family regulatory protein
MPIYAYHCTACGHRFDRLQKLSDPDPDVCPECGVQGEVKRQLTAPAFRLAGSGWYETDFKKEGDRKRNLVEGGEGVGKAETKPGGDKPLEKKPDVAKPAADAKPVKSDAKPAAKPAADA